MAISGTTGTAGTDAINGGCPDALTKGEKAFKGTPEHISDRSRSRFGKTATGFVLFFLGIRERRGDGEAGRDDAKDDGKGGG